MTTSKTNELFALIRSLSKSEKRAFRLFTQRGQDSEQLIYMRLFDLLDKQQQLDEDSIKASFGKISSNKYSNLKRHLYKQILVSLRLLSVKKRANIKMREYLDFAYVLYGKGLYMDALKMLDKAEQIAVKHNHEFTLLIIYEFEKMIHSRHITRSQLRPVKQLIEESTKKLGTISNRVHLSNLRLALHAYYVKNGHAQNEEEEQAVREFYRDNLPELDFEQLGHMERVHFYQSNVWYYYILSDFESCFEQARKWVEMFKADEALQHRDINLFLRGYHYLLTCAFYLRRKEAHMQFRAELLSFVGKHKQRFTDNSHTIAFLYEQSAQMNQHFLDGSYSQGVSEVPNTIALLKKHQTKIDEHKILIIYFKISWMYLASGQAQEAIPFLNHIISLSNISLRKDIQAYARLMSLMANYDSGNTEFMRALLRTYRAFFKRHEIENQVQILTLKLFTKLINAPLYDRKQLLRDGLLEFQLLERQKHARRDLQYLDCQSWISAKLRGLSIEELIN